MKKVVFVLLAIISTNLYAQDFQAPSDWKSISEKNLTIRFPEQFTSYKDAKSGIELALLFPKKETISPFQENILLITDNSLPKGVSVKFFKQTSLDELKRTIPDFSLKEEAELTIDNVSFEKIVYYGKYNNQDIIMTQYFSIVKNVVYILSYTSVEELYEGSKDLAEKIIKTCTFKKKK